MQITLYKPQPDDPDIYTNIPDYNLNDGVLWFKTNDGKEIRTTLPFLLEGAPTHYRTS
jgi:hypothetical protein